MSLSFDISGFESLFQVNYQPLCAAAYRIVQDKDIAEDIVQDVFIKVWQKRESLDISISVKAYLFKSTINQSLNHIKKVSNMNEREAQYTSEYNDDVNSTEQIIALKETRQRIDAAIKALPQACRTVFILSRYEHLSYKEIASELDISIKTVENQMVKALKYLRKCLSLLFLFLII
jgi:RNA polymerase sigma-70 factor (ECF subfamily)